MKQKFNPVPQLALFISYFRRIIMQIVLILVLPILLVSCGKKGDLLQPGSEEYFAEKNNTENMDQNNDEILTSPTSPPDVQEKDTPKEKSFILDPIL